MNARVETAARWVLVLVTFSASSLAVFFLAMGRGTLLPGRVVIAAASALGMAPGATLELVHRFNSLLLILIWVVPPTCAVGLALRVSQRRALQFAFSISVLLLAIMCSVWGVADRSVPVQAVSVIAVVIVLSTAAAVFFRLNCSRHLAVANLIAVLLLFAP